MKPTVHAIPRTCITILAGFACAGAIRAEVTFESLPAAGDVIGMGQPGAVSFDGSTIVGTSWSISKWQGQSFSWTREGGVRFLETSLPVASRAGGTSADGAVVAGQRFADFPQAACWAGGTLKALSSNRSAAVSDVAKDGKTIVGSNPAALSIAPLAAKWSVAAAGTAAAVALGDLAGGATESEAKRISADGTTIVGWGTSTNGVEAFRIVGTGPMTALGELPGGKYFSEASAVSADGTVVVGRSRSTHGPEAFRWTAATGMVGLGDLPGGAFCSEATGVSGDGTIVVGTSASAADTDVFVWTAAGGMRSLAALCRAANVDLTGWRFTYSRPVMSEDGNVLSGDAISPAMDQVIWRLAGLRELANLPGTLFWQGNGTTNPWDVAVTADWTDGASVSAFSNGIGVTFDDLGSNSPVVNLTGSLAPAAVVVRATRNYTFGGPGSLAGTLALDKAGIGTLTLTGNHSFSGGTTVHVGTLDLSGSLTDTGVNGVQVMPGATLHLSGGTLRANLHIWPGAFLTGFGTIVGNVINDGTLAAEAGGILVITGEVTNNGTNRISNSTELHINGSFVNNGVLDVITGSVRLPAAFINNGVILDSSSVRVQELTKTGTTVRLTIRSVAGHVYQLQHNPQLAAGSWTPVGSTQDGTGEVLTFTDGGASGPCGFYRIAVLK
ncbi:MAG: autotransporter-associated beta strand repeat-containing protein [Verrucomicrobia bacterium]|nr:autotransporter-associated beta strand repeat-containing protein [Verrucomicrobiota bacterium]